jgi:hypothetical protein
VRVTVRVRLKRSRDRVLGPTRMARKLSALSLSSPPSSSAELQPLSKAIPHLSSLSSSQTPTSPRPLRNASFLASSRNPHAPNLEHPDDLFTKLTIPEVKQVHQRLLCAIPLHICLTLTLKPRATGLMPTSNKKNYGLWSGAYLCSPPCSYWNSNTKAQGTVSRSPAGLFIHNIHRTVFPGYFGRS